MVLGSSWQQTVQEPTRVGCGVHAFGSTQAAKLHWIGGASPYLLLLGVDDSAVEEEGVC